ncbi:response regulator transcription factor [Prolixibacteraceae bacterium JC049]|nr:response regulator transcription factor [Prolixibacteraceae bacterium JC049]
MKIKGLKYFLASNNNEVIHTIQEYFKKTMNLDIAISSNAESALFNLFSQSYDVVFIDFNLDKHTGIELATILHTQKYTGDIFLISSNTMHAVDAIKAGALGFIPTPIDEKNLSDELTKLNQHLANNESLKEKELQANSFLQAEINQKNTKVPTNTIAYLEADKSYTNIYLNDGTTGLVCAKIKQVEEQLNNDQFIRINRSVIINTEFLYTVNKVVPECQLKFADKAVVLKVTLRNLPRLMSHTI